MDKTRDCPEEHALARAVDAEEAVDSPALEVKGYVVEHGPSANDLRRVRDPDDVCHDGLPSDKVGPSDQADKGKGKCGGECKEHRG